MFVPVSRHLAIQGVLSEHFFCFGAVHFLLFMAHDGIYPLNNKRYLSPPLHNTILVDELLCVESSLSFAQQNRVFMRTVSHDSESLTNILT